MCQGQPAFGRYCSAAANRGRIRWAPEERAKRPTGHLVPVYEEILMITAIGVSTVPPPRSQLAEIGKTHSTAGQRAALFAPLRQHVQPCILFSQFSVDLSSTRGAETSP